jgi:uncharacterized protein (DUF952 family)
VIYKIVPRGVWEAAGRTGVLSPALVDVKDGYVHLSSADQVRETARRHFAGQGDLVLLTVDPARLPAGALRWEPSRGGALFPHLHGELRAEHVVAAEPLPIEGGAHRFPAGVP